MSGQNQIGSAFSAVMPTGLNEGSLSGDPFENLMVDMLKEIFVGQLVVVWTDPTALPLSSGHQAQATFSGYLDKVTPFGILIRHIGPVEDTYSFFWLDKIVGIEIISEKNEKFLEEKRRSSLNASSCGSCATTPKNSIAEDDDLEPQHEPNNSPSVQ